MFRSVAGGFLVQARDRSLIKPSDLKIVTRRQPTPTEIQDMLFAFTVAKHVKSNAIVYAKDGATAGVGAGQMNRLESARIAAWKARDAAEKAAPGTRVLRVEAVGNTVSAELFQGGLMALGLSFLAMLLYIWFRFEWHFGVAAIATLLLDTTKTVGFMVLFGIEFNLTTVAAILTVIGFSANDKVVVFDRMRENLRRYKAMPMRELVDLSINETMNRSLGTSVTLLLSAVPLALFGVLGLAAVVAGRPPSTRWPQVFTPLARELPRLQPTLLHDLLDAMAALHLHRVVLLGTSFGGILAMSLGVLRPGALAAVAMMPIREGRARSWEDSSESPTRSTKSPSIRSPGALCA